jgi:hypothetical protein
MTVKIYLRAIVTKQGNNSLALFDSNRKGDINDLITDVNPGDKVIWKLDRCSGIRSITRIYSKEMKHPIFTSNPEKRGLCKVFELQVPKTAEPEDQEKYVIEYILRDDTKMMIDPYVRIPPPRIR